jgi:hypothetical protein
MQKTGVSVRALRRARSSGVGSLRSDKSQPMQNCTSGQVYLATPSNFFIYSPFCATMAQFVCRTADPDPIYSTLVGSAIAGAGTLSVACQARSQWPTEEASKKDGQNHFDLDT